MNNITLRNKLFQILKVYNSNKIVTDIIDKALEKYVVIYGIDENYQLFIKRHIARSGTISQLSEQFYVHPRTIYKKLEAVYSRLEPIVFCKEYVEEILISYF